MILRKETEIFQLYQPMIELQKQQIRMNDTPQGDGKLGAFNSTCAFNNFSYKNE